jgi:polyferredoxin
MAQTRKRRQTKHRGNAAGMVESRGRTGRRLEPGERAKLDPKEEARRKRLARLDNPPTWRGALNRAAVAAALFGVLMVVIGNTISAAVSLAAVMLVLYIPMSYYTDLAIYRRRQKKKVKA